VTGSIRERSPGHFELRAFDGTTGKQVTRTYVHPRGEKGTGIRAARAELARLVTEVAGGAHRARRATVAELLDEWIRFGEEARGRSPNTIAGYRAKAGRIKASAVGSRTLAKLTAKDLDDFYLELSADGLSPSSVHHFHRVLRAALNQAVKWGWVDANVTHKATAPTVVAPEVHVPTLEQARALVVRAEKTASPDLGPIILFAMLSGLRRGELCGLQWRDVDWKHKRVLVRRSVWQVRSSWGVKEPKTHQMRSLALDEFGMALLTARRDRAQEEARAARVELTDEAFLWSSHVDGRTPRTPNSLSRMFHHLCELMSAESKAAGRPAETWPFRFHDLRHWSATQMVATGYDPRTVATRLGHSDPAITLRVYAHAVEARDRNAAEDLGRALGAPNA
jgi:integrase